MYYPNPELPEEETPPCSKYGRMRHTYLRDHKKAYYTTLLFGGKLVAHLNEIDEALKAKDQMAWVGAMNNIRNAAEEIVLSELIYN